MTLIMKPYFLIGILSTYLFACCSSDSVNETVSPTPPSEKLPINISTSVSSRATDLLLKLETRLVCMW